MEYVFKRLTLHKTWVRQPTQSNGLNAANVGFGYTKAVLLVLQNLVLLYVCVLIVFRCINDPRVVNGNQKLHK